MNKVTFLASFIISLIIVIGFARPSNVQALTSVSLSNPTNGTEIAGSISINALASTDIVAVKFLVDGITVGTEDTSSPFSIFWDSSLASNGSHVITAQARNGSGQSVTSAPVSVTVFNRSISISQPITGETVSGVVKIIAATVGDFQGVDFFVQSVKVFSDDSAPYEYSWDTRALPNQKINLYAEGRFGTNQAKFAKQIPVTVQNVAVTLLSPAGASTVNGTITVSATTVGPNIQRVDFIVDGVVFGSDETSPYAISLNTLTLNNGLHLFSAKAYSASDSDTSGLRSITVANTSTTPQINNNNASTTVPTATLSIQTSAGIISGASVPLTLKLQNGTAQRVSFFRDQGVSLGSDTQYPHVLTWDSRTVRNGNHVITAQVKLVDGTNLIVSKTFTIKNTLTVTIPGFSKLRTLSGKYPLKMKIYGGEVLKRAVYYLDGREFNRRNTAPFSLTLNTMKIRNGLHTMLVVVTDSKGSTARKTFRFNVEK